MAYSKDVPAIEVEVPPDFAAQFLTEHMGTAPGKRPLLPLRLGDTDLGMWEVVKVASVRRPAGYDKAVATLRAMWE
jgi:hypothetical protein